MSAEHIKKAERRCPICNGIRIIEVDMQTGRYNALIPARCRTEDECEDDLIKAANFER